MPLANKKYRDRLFRMLFNTAENALSLYNAVNNTSYTNADDLEITTIDDVIYMGMRNDVSFSFVGYENLYEHQSTVNPNLPLRGLLYFAKLFEQYIVTSGRSKIYRNQLLPLPTPKFVVFYNGKKEIEDHTLRLTDAFQFPKESDVQVSVRVININAGHNTELKERCKVLKEYSILVDKVKEKEASLGFQRAVVESVNESIAEGILEEFLTKHRAEVVDMLLTEFDEKEYQDFLYNEGLEKGREEGREDTIVSLVKEGLLSPGIAAEKLSMSKAELDELLHS